ncbi:putative electron transport protein YccM [mine drainage metagenome]|uniref:Putative electron transport protein YccM n=1 Tax=mine drainage metagenome TaxID=410659 RepID=A0A1J5QT03_9ZZZZ
MMRALFLLRRWLLPALLLVLAAPAFAGVDAKYPEVRQAFPQATRFGDIEGKPPAAAVYQGDKVIGYVFETVMVAPIPAYSGEPINILVAIDEHGRILAARVLEQHEPILLVGIPVQKLYDFVARYIGHSVTDSIVVGNGVGQGTHIDAISSATVTSMVVNETIMNSALKVAASRRIVSAAKADEQPAATVKKTLYAPADWKTLTGNGAIRRLHLARGSVSTAFSKDPLSGLVDDPTAPDPGHEKDTFIDLYYADATPPSVGRNLLGASAYAQVMKSLQPGDELIAVMANGIYSFKGLGYVRGGIFDRLHVMQGDKLYLFKDSDYLPLDDVQLGGMPAFDERALFVLRHGQGFDPGRAWTLQLLVRRQVGPLKSVYHTFTAGYQIPPAYVDAPPPPAHADWTRLPMWQQIWLSQRVDIAVLGAGLAVLSLILLFQDWLVKRPRLLERLRVGYLVYTAVFIGWYGLAQLSAVNILTFVHAVLTGFHWSIFLMDPLIFILWVFVAVTLLLVGRGVYCGWLCPFGAIQVLVNKLARRLHVPQLQTPSYVHERLWALKYVILLVLFGMSLQSLGLAERYIEVEPFKTAINFHFVRSWGYELYAIGLVAIAAFNNKFYCRYLCPLGAGLSVAGRWRLFEWLKRRRECGRPCQVCAVECEVQAINPIGQINFNECHYCLDCQVTYWNDRKCPPLVSRRKRREASSTTKTIPIQPVPEQPAGGQPQGAVKAID